MIKMEITNATVTPMKNSTIMVFPVKKEGSKIHAVIKFQIETKKLDTPDSTGKVFMGCTIFSKSADATEKFKSILTEGTILNIKGGFSVDIDKNDKTKKYNVCEVQELNVLSQATPADTGYNEGSDDGANGADDLPF